MPWCVATVPARMTCLVQAPADWQAMDAMTHPPGPSSSQLLCCCVLCVLAWELCPGCGKTELCRRFEETGFDVLDEAFLDMPEYMLHPQSLLMETTWVCAWYVYVPSPRRPPFALQLGWRAAGLCTCLGLAMS